MQLTLFQLPSMKAKELPETSVNVSQRQKKTWSRLAVHRGTVLGDKMNAISMQFQFDSVLSSTNHSTNNVYDQ